MSKAGSVAIESLWLRELEFRLIGTLSQLEFRLGQRAATLHFSFQATTSRLFDSQLLNIQNGYVSFKENKYVVHSLKEKDLEDLMVLV